MRRSVLTLAFLAIASLTAVTAQAGDQEIAEQIVQNLEKHKSSGSLKGFDVDLQVQDGIVWLQGTVSHEKQQSLVLDSARFVPGVKSVVNALAIAPGATSPSVAAQNEPIPAPQSTASAKSRGLISRFSKPSSTVPASAEEPVDAAAPTGFSYEEPQPVGTAVAAFPAPPAGPQAVVPQLAPQAMAPQVAVAQAAAPAQFQPAPSQQLSSRNVARMPTPVDPRVATYNRHYGQQQQPQAPQYVARNTANNNVVQPAGPAVGPQAYLPAGPQVQPARYDHPYMPNYSWPAYAAYPNYAGVTYPQQYSPTAWPYIGPFYPYPQVPLGWRKVTLEWDDGWWMLDFKDR